MKTKIFIVINMLSLIIFLFIIELNICFETSPQYISISNEEIEQTFWSRIKDITPPNNNANKNNLRSYSPKYIFKGLKDRISSDLDNDFVNNETPLSTWATGNISNNENDHIVNSVQHDEKLFWNISSNEIIQSDINIGINNETNTNKSELFDSQFNSNENIEDEIKILNLTESLAENSFENKKSLILSSKESGSITKFPIYFTNPATGIVYVIHPIGKAPTQYHPYTIENYASQMYVTKDEYKRKIEILKEHYGQQIDQLQHKLMEQNKRWKDILTRISSTTSTTKKPSKRKNIVKYTEPLVFETVGNVLDNVYDQVADTVTTKVTIKKKKKNKKNKKKKKKNSIKRRKSTKTKISRRKSTTAATTIMTPMDSFENPMTDHYQEQQTFRPLKNEWNGPNHLSAASAIKNYDNNEDNYDDDKRYTLISYNGGNLKNFESKTIVKPLDSITAAASDNRLLIPVPLTPVPKVKKRISKRSITSQNSQNSLDMIHLKVSDDGIDVVNHNKSNNNSSYKTSDTLSNQTKMVTAQIKSNSKNPNQTTSKVNISTPNPPLTITQASYRKYEKKTADYDDYFFDFDDIIYNDYSDSLNFVQKETFEHENEDLNSNFLRPTITKENGHDSIINILDKKKNVRKNPDYDYSYDDDYPAIFDFITNIVNSIQKTVGNFFPESTDEFSLPSDNDDNDDNDLDVAETNNDIRKSNNKPNLNSNYQTVEVEENNDDDGDVSNNGNGIGSWFTSWFGSAETDSVENEPIDAQTEEPGWFDSWFGNEEKTSSDTSNENENNNENWLFGWFDSEKEKDKKNSKTKLVTTTSKPILTVSDPMVNPQKWIGILAQHIVNSTTTSSTLSASSSEPIDDYKSSVKVTYDKYQVWRLKLNKETQLKALEKYKNSEEGVKLLWLIGPSLRGLNDVAVPIKLVSNFQQFLKSELITHEVLIFDLGKAILYENSKEKIALKLNKRSHPLTWHKYHNYDEIIRFEEFCQVKNQDFVELLHIGRSYEGRPLIVVKISHRNDAIMNSNIKKKKKLKNRSGILIEAGVHGREWIGTASATWIINELIKIMKNNQTTPENETIKKITWYIMPVLNPDGYTYSQEYDRFWRKSRSKNVVRSSGILTTAINWIQQTKPKNKICYGVDLDRNWDYEWSRKGSSKSACNEFFAGRSAFSEPETKAFSKFLLDYRKDIKLFISLQSYGQIISYPTQIKSSFASQKLEDLLDVAMVGVDELRKSGSKARYKIDSSNDLISVKSGSSDYYAINVAGIPYSYTLYLGDNGVHGYLLPGSYIDSTSRDAFKIIKAMINYIF